MNVDTLGRYSVFENQSGAPTQSSHGEQIWRKAFSHDLRCYAALAVIPKESFASEESREEFIQEVRIASGVRHRSVALVFPLEVIDDSYIYAREFCDGETVADRTRRTGCIEALAALNIASQIAAGLEAASTEGLLHRNIAAENILLLPDDDEMSAKLLGLGLPARTAMEDSAPPPEFDFRSPEEIDGTPIDIRSEIYSLGALLYFMEAGPENYALFRAKSLTKEEVNLFGDVESFSQRIRMVVAGSARRDPKKRVATFAELADLIEQARTAPEEFYVEGIAAPTPKEDAPGISAPTPAERPAALEVAETPPPKSPTSSSAAANSPALRPGELMIPVELLGVAQPGTVLRLTRVEEKARERVTIYVGDSFGIGRSDDLELVTRFLPRSKTNDKATMRLSKKQVTFKCEEGKVLLSDGSGGKPSTNGSIFDTQELSAKIPMPLVKAGELKLADVYSVKVIPSLEDVEPVPAIANLGEWRGSSSESNPAMRGAILFVPIEPYERGFTIWLFSTASFGINDVSSLDFTSVPKIGALRHFRGCFWIEQRSTEPLLVDGLPMGLWEIAPLTTGQTVEVRGSKYAVEVRASIKQPKA